MNKTFVLYILIIVLLAYDGVSQQTGESIPAFNPDTVFIFEPARPLLRPARSETFFNKALGFNLKLSSHGFGAGGFHSWMLSKNIESSISFYISGARKSDEIEYYDPRTGQIFIPGKVNRLYLIPITLSFKYHLFNEQLDNTFKPYIDFGLGPSLILSNPYEIEFFSALKYTRLYTRFGTYLGFGSYLMSTEKSLMGIDARYYYIPFGGEGIESIVALPIKDFGGLFLSLSIGVKL